jgi:acyl-CoA synthetase (AMP-forming)/AMP-acid ligase II
MRETIHDIFAETSAKHPGKPFVCVPPSDTRDWLRSGGEFTYGEVSARVERLRRAYAEAGYGHGHRVLVSVENRHEHFEHFLALNALGASLVPGNADYRHDELVYHIGHSESDLVVTVPRLRPALEAAAQEAGGTKPVAVIGMGDAIPPARRPAPLAGRPHPQS